MRKIANQWVKLTGTTLRTGSLPEALDSDSHWKLRRGMSE